MLIECHNIVGLTGGIGSGKSAVSDIFASLGVDIIDTDVISRNLTGAQGVAMPKICSEFGKEFSTPDGALNRIKMRELVYQDYHAKQRLEQIIHPMIFEQCIRYLEKVKSVYVLLVVPLLFETDRFVHLVSRILLVDCDASVQLFRVMQRDGLTEWKAKAIINSQLSRDKRLALSDDIITNDGDRKTLQDQVHTMHRRYLKMFC